MTALHVDLLRHPDRPVMHLVGELDITALPVLRQAVDAALAAQPATLEVDVAALTFCDSSGLQGLLQIQHAADQNGAALRLAHVQGQLHRVLRLTRLEAAFDIAPAATT